MEEPILHFSTAADAQRLCYYLKTYQLTDQLQDLQKYNTFSFHYDTKQGEIRIIYYLNNQVIKVSILTVDEQIDRYKLWQYFYQPEHRNDWED